MLVQALGATTLSKSQVWEMVKDTEGTVKKSLTFGMMRWPNERTNA